MSEIIVSVDPEEVPNVIIKVDENSAQTAIDAAAAAQLALSQMQNAEYGNLSARILDLELPDGLVATCIIVQVGPDVTVAANQFSVRKDQLEVFNSAFAGTIAGATDLYNRVDIFEIDNAGIIYIKPGDEDLEFFLKPSPTAGRYEIGFVNISGAIIGNVAAVSNGYIEKTELSSKKLQGSGAKAQFSIDSEVATFRIVQASSIASVYVANANKKFIYAGKDHYVKNETGTTLIIKHNSGTGNYKYAFASETDLTIQNNEIVHFKFRFTNGNNGVLDYVGVIYDKTKVGLGNLDNTSDVNKPVSTLQASADATVLADGKTYADGLITQLINGAPADGNTLKELNDKIIAVQAIIGGSTADGDAIVNTVSELLAVFATFPEAVDLVTLLAGKVNTTDVYNALDCIVAGKVLDARQGKVLNDLITTLRADVTANTTAIGLRELSSNKSQDVETDKASTTKFGSVKAIYDWCVGRFQPKLTAGTNVTIDNTNPLAPVINATSSGGGLTVTQVISQTLIVANWALVSGYYEYNLSNADITATSVVDAIPNNASVTIIKTAEILPKTLSGAGTVKFYAVNLPTGNIIVTINIFK